MIFIAMLLWGCGGEEAECSSDEACGFGEVCISGKCSGRTCATSAQCGMESYCDAGACKTGCENDGDCYPGDACDSVTATCATAACTDSRVDCSFGEFCNGVTGDCYEAGGYYCAPCADDSDCGGGNNYCLNLGYAESNFCGVECTTETDCPNGYSCVGVGDRSGNIIAYQCLTYCWLYEDEKKRSAP